MALDHPRLIWPGKKIRSNFFAFDKFTSQNLANKSGCVLTNLIYHLYITSEGKQYYEALFLSYRPRTTLLWLTTRDAAPEWDQVRPVSLHTLQPSYALSK